MKKDIFMKKNTFVNGALFVSISIILTKILGVLYIIPFYSLIGEKGGALYGYAYSIYVFFISISSAGIPLAISKIISEYNTLGNYDARNRAFYLGKRIALLMGFVSFLILNIFASSFANMIVPNVSGGNSVEDIALVLRVVSTAILIVPLLSIYRGYFQGFKFMEPSSISQVLEQIIRIIVIIIGSFFTLKVFKLSLASAVGVAVFGATFGALVAYFYLALKLYNNRNKFKNTKPKIKVPISDKSIIKKIAIYAFPLIMIDLSKSIYNFIDTFSVVNGLVEHANYEVAEAEVIVSMLSTWASKFNMLISAVATGIVVSLIPNLTEAIVNKDKEEIDSKINQSISLCLLLTVPMTFGISLLSQYIWTIFYGVSEIGPQLLSFYILTGLVSSLFTVVITIIQLFKDNKILFISLFAGIIIKVLFNIPLIGSFYREGLPPYYGVIMATLFGYIVSLAICFTYLHFKKKINFEKLITNLFDILCAGFFMLIILLVINHFISFNTSSRILNLLIVLGYAIFGSILFIGYCYKCKVFENILGKNFKNILKK